MIGARDGDAQGLAGHPQALLHRLIGLIGVTRDDVRPLGAPTRALAARAAFLSEALRPAEFDRRVARPKARSLPPPSPPRSRALRSSPPTTRPKRRWRWPSRCAKFWKRRARPRRSSRPIRRSRAGCRRSSRDGASRSRIRPGARSASARRARWPGSSCRRRSSSRRARFSRSSPIRRRASAAAAPRLTRRRGRWSSPFFAPSRSIRSTISTRFRGGAGRSRRPSCASRGPPIGEARRAAAERLARDARGARPFARAQALAPLGDWLDAHRVALSAVVAAPERRRAAPHGSAALTPCRRMERGGGDGFPCALGEYVGLFDDALARRARSAAPGGHPRLRSSACSKRACSTSIACLWRASTKRLAAGGRDRRLSQPADARRARPIAAGAAHRPDGARFRRRARGARGDLEPGEEARRRATVASRFLQRLAAAAGAPATEAPRSAARPISPSRARSTSRQSFRPSRRRRGRRSSFAAGAKRHPDRDLAARPLRDLRRAGP